MHTGGLAVKEKARCDSYRFLAACFYIPRKEMFLQEDLFKNLTESLRKSSPDSAEFSVRMGEAVMQYSNEDLSAEYAKLFVGPYEIKAPPYGSLYLDSGKKIMGDSTLEVTRIYQSTGLSIDDEFKELPDHITVELEFMYYLTYREAEALEKAGIDEASGYLRTQALFLDNFLGRWIQPFCRKIKEATDNGFYRALAGCVSTFTVNDQAHVKALLKESSPWLSGKESGKV